MIRTKKIHQVLAEGGQNVYGLGVTLEAFDVNPMMYEFVFEQAWEGSNLPMNG